MSMTMSPEPFPPSPFPRHDTPPQVPTPVVYVAPVWEYKELVRNPETEALPTEDELNALGSDGWELTAVVSVGARVHFYFKLLRD